MTLSDHIPRRQEIFYVFGGVVFIIYSWAIRGFLYQFSSLRLYHTLDEILAVFSYLMAFALLESLLIMSALIIIGIILPRKWYREGFAYKGFITILVTGTALIWLHFYLFSLNYAMPPMSVIYQGVGIVLFLLVLLMVLVQNIPKLQRFLLALEERLQIFLYIYIPLGALGVAVVVLRTIW